MRSLNFSAHSTSSEALRYETSAIETLQRRHEELLQKSDEEKEAGTSSINDFLKDLANAGVIIRYSAYRSQLRSLILYWSNFLSTRLEPVPIIQLQPFDESRLHSEKENKSLQDEEQVAPSYLDNLVQINLENLVSYYNLVKQQTNKSFLAFIVIAAIGTTLIGFSLVTVFTTSINAITYIAAASGILIELIAALFFQLYNRSVSQMKGYHDSLLSVQNILLLLKIVEETQDEKERNKMMNQILAYLVGKRDQAVP